MIAKLLNLGEKVRSSLWFVPSVMTLGAALLAFACGAADRALAGRDEYPDILLYVGDREGARTILATVAGAMITVAGVTFSVTIVALSLASQQFGPRLLQNFMRDRGNQIVLGTFIATHFFGLVGLAQGTTRSELVPVVTTSVALALAIASIGVLIYFIHHVATSIRAAHIVAQVAGELAGAVDELVDDGDESETEREVTAPDGAPCLAAPRDGYLQRVDCDGLVSVARRRDLVLRGLRRPGTFLVEGEPLLAVHGVDALDDELRQQLAKCFIVAHEATREQDVLFGANQLVDVALRALSPGFNDPRTAIASMRWLGAVLAKLAGRPVQSVHHRDSEGRLRYVGAPIRFEELLAACFDPIRRAARAMPGVSMAVLEALAPIARAANGPDRRDAIGEQADMVLHGALAERVDSADRRRLRELHACVLEALGRTRAAAPRGHAASEAGASPA